MLYQQDISGFLQNKVGERGIHRIDLERSFLQAEKAQTQIREKFEQGLYPFLQQALEDKDFPLWEPCGKALQKNYEAFLILGTGGSSLGAKTLVPLYQGDIGAPFQKPLLYFLENVDPHSLLILFKYLPLSKTGIIAISKSGTTAETLAQLLTCEALWKEKGLEKDFYQNTLIITEPKSSPLTRFAQNHNIPCLDHNPNIGGRFSVFSLVGLLPACIAGIDPRKIRQGGSRVLMQFLQNAASDVPPVIGAASLFALQTERGISQTVLMPYIDRLASFGLWFRQLWAESLGKEGQGTTPIRAMGTVDQHSQLQLYLEGPKDKSFTLLDFQNYPKEENGPLLSPSDPDLTYLKGAALGDLLCAEERATYQSLMNYGCPVRRITFDKLDEEVLGGLLMHFMLETLLMGELLGIDLLSQPAVEESKRLTREYLKLKQMHKPIE